LELIMMRFLFCFFILVTVNILFSDGLEPLGSGTLDDPFQIEVLENLLWISTNVNSWDRNFIQTANIDASDTQNWNDGDGFSPIGYDYNSTESEPFIGFYDGQNYYIEELYINREDSDNQGLFGYTYGASLCNICITDFNVTGDSNIGGLVGKNGYYSDIYNCSSTGVISGESRVGNLIGRNNGTIELCQSSGYVNGSNYIGGLTGSNGYIIDSYFHNGCITGTGSTFGGLVGGLAIIENSFYNYENVLINEENVITIGAIENLEFTEWISNNLYLDIYDFLVFDGEHFLISSFSDLKSLWIFGQYDCNFLLTNDIDLSNNPGFYIPYFNGHFDGNNYRIINSNINLDWCRYLGFWGFVHDSEISNTGLQNIQVNGAGSAGGLIGFSTESSISNCFSTGDVNSYGPTGGLIGYCGSGTNIINCFSKCDVLGNNDTGGLVGRLRNDSVIINSFSSGDIIGVHDVGGLVGDCEGGSDITNCYSIGNVTGNDDVGGLAGEGNGTISFCYSTGYVEGNEFIGGLIGGYNSYTYCSFWDIESSLCDISAGGTGKTTEEMRKITTFTDISTIGLDSPWDFIGDPFDDSGYYDYWDIDSDINNGYPFLLQPDVDSDNNEIPSVPISIFNYPNPFNPSTTISFYISEDSNVSLSIYNMKGQRINLLVQDHLQKGKYDILWDGNDYSDKPTSSGVYICFLVIDDRLISTRKCLLLK
jgi:GLUG motif-containing protein